MSTVTPIIKCILIGKESLAYECAKRLLDHPEYQLLAIISTDPLLQTLADERNTPCFSNSESWLSSEKQPDFDYLFSIINGMVLTPQLLNLPRRGAINFHDSLLPRYAGLHATSWAILNQESIHGVTWHMMSEGIDTGEIIKQKKVKVGPDDTALLLNMKCYEVALDLFDEITDDLQRIYLITQPQDLSQRSYYGSNDKPPFGGVLNFSDSSENLYRSWRAMYFGHHPNDFASCKLLVGSKCFIIHEMRTAPTVGTHKPGQIITITNEYLHIATKTNTILITSLKTLEGLPCSTQEFKQLTQLNEGDVLPAANQDMLSHLSSQINQLSPNEPFWVNERRSVSPTTFPYFSHATAKSCTSSQKKINFQDLPQINNIEMDWEISILSFIAIYLFRLTNKNEISLGITIPQYIDEAEGPFFSNTVPLNIKIEPHFTFRDIYYLIEKQKNLIDKNATYLNDITYRYADLIETASAYLGIYPCLIEVRDKNYVLKNDQKELNTPHFKILIDKDARECMLILSSSSQEDIKPKELVKHIHAHLS
jgi:methionyl-tRNA formyltransferase